MTKVYIVTVEGVYIKSVLGAYETEKQANVVAITAASADRDSYHNYNVYEYNLNESLKPNGDSYGCIFDMPKAAYSIDKKGTKMFTL